MKKSLFLTVLFILPGFFSLSGAVLVKNGRPEAVIRLKKDAPEPVKLAAEEIAAYAKKISSAVLPVQENAKGRYVISFEIRNDPALGKEGYRLTGNKNSLVIAGSTPRGVL